MSTTPAQPVPISWTIESSFMTTYSVVAAFEDADESAGLERVIRLCESLAARGFTDPRAGDPRQVEARPATPPAAAQQGEDLDAFFGATIPAGHAAPPPAAEPPRPAPVRAVAADKVRVGPAGKGVVRLEFVNAGGQVEVGITTTPVKALELMQPTGAWNLAHFAAEFKGGKARQWPFPCQVDVRDQVGADGQPYRHIVAVRKPAGAA